MLPDVAPPHPLAPPAEAEPPQVLPEFELAPEPEFVMRYHSTAPLEVLADICHSSALSADIGASPTSYPIGADLYVLLCLLVFIFDIPSVTGLEPMAYPGRLLLLTVSSAPPDHPRGAFTSFIGSSPGIGGGPLLDFVPPPELPPWEWLPPDC